jgi:hypothetical protein
MSQSITLDVEVNVTTEPGKLVRMEVTKAPADSQLHDTTWEWELSQSRPSVGLSRGSGGFQLLTEVSVAVYEHMY